MLLGVSSDEHLDVYKSLSRGIIREDGLSKRLGEQVDEATLQKDRLAKEGVTVILRLGDLFNSRRAVNAMVLNAARRILSHGNFYEYLIGGNHCEYNFDDRLVSPKALEDSRTRVLDTDTTCMAGKGVSLFGMSYQHSDQAFMRNIKSLIRFTGGSTARREKKIILLHQELSDIPVSKSGETVNSWLSADWLNENLGEHFDWILVGHHHNYKRVGKVFIPGAASQLNFGDIGCKRGVWIIDTDTGKARMLESPGPKFIECDLEEWERHWCKSKDTVYPRVKVRTSQLTDALRETLNTGNAGVVMVDERKETSGKTAFDPITAVKQIISEAPEPLDEELLLHEFSEVQDAII